MRSIVLLVSILFCFLGSMDQVDAQVRKRTTSSKKDKITKEKEVKGNSGFLDKGYAELKFGNLGFFNGLSVSSKLNVGYKLHDRFSVGGGVKMFYVQEVQQNAPDPYLFDVGGFIHARAKITNEIYFQGEYASMKYEFYTIDFNGDLIKTKANANYPLVGLGYMSGGDKWRFGIELLYIASERARDLQNSVVEYWFGASYNF